MRFRTSLTVVVAVVISVVGHAGTAYGATLTEAREAAEEAASRLATARARHAELEREIANLEAEKEAARRRLAKLGTALEELAVEDFMSGRERATPIRLDDINQSARAATLAQIVTRDVADTAEQYRIASEDLERADVDLARAKAEAAEAIEQVQKESAAATAELRRMERAAAASARTGGGGGGGGGNLVIGGDGGGWLCPVQGPRSFINDWGMPRSGGRRHQGTDILSPRGTPVVASVSGTARTHSSSLGGLSYYLEGDDGNTYFGTHLSSYSGASGRVERGRVLGYVGNSGNARGGPTHLHFEIQPGGGSPINPYPTLASRC